MSKIVSSGEIMLRLSPEGCGRLVQPDRFVVIWVGGDSITEVRIVNLDGHTLLSYRVKPGEKFRYDLGYAWDRGDIPEFDSWVKYLTKLKHK